MESTSYLLIGGGLASYQAAKQLRQLDAQATITLVSEEDHLPYDRPPLTKEFLRGEKPQIKSTTKRTMPIATSGSTYCSGRPFSICISTRKRPGCPMAAVSILPRR